MSTGQQLVLREDHGAVAELTLHRPHKLNAWGADLTDDLLAHLDRLRRDDAIRACVLIGHGDRAFSSGADISNRATHRVPADSALAELWRGSTPVFPRVLDFPKPIVAAVNGYAIGAGFLIALCTDVILASETAQFALPQVSLGILPAYGGIARLAQWVGRGRALEIAFTGRRVGAQEAQAIGLASGVYSPAELRDRSLEFARSLAALPAASVKLAKESVLEGLEGSSVRGSAMADLYRTICLQQTETTAEAHEQWRRRHL